MIDLHTHSNNSDGELNPAQLIQKASDLGLKALALTDHDTISGLEEAENASLYKEIRFIPGVELEIEAKFGDISIITGEFHLLGLGITRNNGELLDALEYLLSARERRNREMVEKIRAAGIDVTYEEIIALAGSAEPGKRIIARPHFGAFLISRKIVKNQEQAFNRWLGKGKPFYVPKAGLELQKAVNLIHQAGGAAVLAHPMSLYVSWGRMPSLLSIFKETGMDGIEAWHPNARVRDCKRLEELGLSLGFFITAGSDYHGKNRPERKLGCTAGGRKIEDKYMDWYNLNIINC